jgi:hypothetical protein
MFLDKGHDQKRVDQFFRILHAFPDAKTTLKKVEIFFEGWRLSSQLVFNTQSQWA